MQFVILQNLRASPEGWAPGGSSRRSAHDEGSNDGNRYREVVQRREGVWLHHPGRWRRGRVLPPHRHPGRGLPQPRRGAEGRVRGHQGPQGPGGRERSQSRRSAGPPSLSEARPLRGGRASACVQNVAETWARGSVRLCCPWLRTVSQHGGTDILAESVDLSEHRIAANPTNLGGESFPELSRRFRHTETVSSPGCGSALKVDDSQLIHRLRWREGEHLELAVVWLRVRPYRGVGREFGGGASQHKGKSRAERKLLRDVHASADAMAKLRRSRGPTLMRASAHGALAALARRRARLCLCRASPRRRQRE